MNSCDVLCDVLSFGALAAEAGKDDMVAIVVLNFGIIKVDPKVHTCVGAKFSATSVSVEDERCDGGEEKGTENESVMLVSCSS